MRTVSPRCAMWLVLAIGAVVPLAASCQCHAFAGDAVKIEPDVIYGRKDGMALTMDVITPAKPNGAAVLWIQSGGWFSTSGVCRRGLRTALRSCRCSARLHRCRSNAHAEM